MAKSEKKMAQVAPTETSEDERMATVTKANEKPWWWKWPYDDGIDSDINNEE